MEAEYPIIDNPKKDKLVEECLKAGWTWEKWNNEGTNMVLLPPKGDDRRTWCACWSPWKDKFHMIPHWADPVDPTLKDKDKFHMIPHWADPVDRTLKDEEKA